jgi:hopene-associated glycosyltransferase HpnB
LQIISGSSLPNGWAGKLWALEQGRKLVETDLILLMDADIQLKPGILKTLVRHLKQNQLSFVSLMAELRMQSFWEKLLIPAYIYFFKLLYPFRIGNSPRFRHFAVAAGGCILMKREALEKIGGFGALKEALIDDCTLAKTIKRAGFDTWVGTTHSVTSHRAYDSLQEIWNLVARFAFTYLRYNTALLILCTTLMLSAYWAAPFALLFLEMSDGMKYFLATGYALLFVCYWPSARFYRLNPIWVLLHPLAGSLYMAMTWSSAIRYWRGQRSEWKGRTYDQNLSVKDDRAA